MSKHKTEKEMIIEAHKIMVEGVSRLPAGQPEEGDTDAEKKQIRNMARHLSQCPKHKFLGDHKDSRLVMKEKPLKYSTERPSKCGYYFCKARSYITGGEFETIVKVYSSKNDNTPDTIYWDRANYDLSKSSDLFIKFAGPIRKPIDD